jgi:hypothetical protein
MVRRFICVLTERSIPLALIRRAAATAAFQEPAEPRIASWVRSSPSMEMEIFPTRAATARRTRSSVICRAPVTMLHNMPQRSISAAIRSQSSRM